MLVRRALLIVLVLVTGACAGDGTGAADPAAEQAGAVDVREESLAWPVPDWQTVEPEAAGLDPQALQAMVEEAARTDSRCLVVTKDGRVVTEWYDTGWDATTEQESFSVTKSILSALVGVAADRGLLTLEQQVADFIEEWRGTASEPITIRNLLSNDSGRFHDVPTDYLEMAAHAHDKTAFAIGLAQQHPVGSTWVYNNSAIQVLEQVLEEATGMPTATWAQTVLFEPLGMETHLETDGAGNALVFMGARASCRDLARFGLLWLRGGEWAGEQVVSRSWVERSVTPSQELNPEYGLLWWLADGHYAATGLNDQYVVVFPEDGIVVTRLGGAGFGRHRIVEHVEAAS